MKSRTRWLDRSFPFDNVRQVGNILAEFRSVRGASMKRYDAVDDATVIRAIHHPRLNRPMRMVDMVYFLAEHDDHHLAEMVYLWRQHEAAGIRQ